MTNKKQILLILLTSFLFIAKTLSWAAENPRQLIAKGQKFYQKGDFEHAALTWEQTLTLLSQDTGPYLNTVIHLAYAYQSLGYHKKAVALLQKTLPITEKSSDKYKNALLFNILGDIHLSLGNFEKALKYLEKGANEAHLSKNIHAQASVLNNIGNAFSAYGDYAEALKIYENCLKILSQATARDNEYSQLKSKILINLVTVRLYNGSIRDASKALENALAHISSLPDSHSKAADLLSLSELSQQIKLVGKKSEKTHTNLSVAGCKMLNQAKQIAENLQDLRISSYACGYMGLLYEEEGRYPEAMKLTRTAIFHAQQGNYPEILYLWQWQMGRLFKAKGDIENAIRSYKNSVSALNPIRTVFFRGLRLQEATFDSLVKPVYLGLAELLLEQAEKNRDSETQLFKEARDTVELLKTAELQDFFGDECVSLAQSKMTTLDRTPPGTAVIYPIILPEKLVLLLTLPDRIKQISVPVDAVSLEYTVSRFRKALQNRMNNRFLYDAEQLYDWIIRPIEASLAASDISTLIFAPDGALRLIPLSALYNGTRYLVEKYATGIIPGMTLTDPEPFQQKNPGILLGGLSEGRQGFSPLPSVSGELSDIKKIMQGRIILQNSEFTTDKLTDEFKNHEYSIVHMATHGVFGGTPEQSFLLNYDGRLTMDRLEQLISLSRFRDMPVELLTLSACQTALGNERAALGLAGVAVKAGVRSAIATLWYVDDEATSLAIREFYQQLKTPGISKARALQNAQKKLIAQPRYWHPLYWSPFLLIGNWL